MRVTICALVSLSVSVAVAEKQPFSRYQSIVDRQMFGPLPPGFDSSKLPSEVARSGGGASAKELTKEQEKLQSSVHFSVINVDHEGKVVVGFTDNSDPKAPVHYYMRVGETQNGWCVKEANQEDATMTIVKDDIEVSLTLGDNSAKGGGKTSAANGGAASGIRQSRMGMLSLSERRAKRAQAEKEDAQKRAAEAAERAAQAEQEKADREREREAQRQQLMSIQEELKRVREQRESEKANQKAENGDGGGDAE